MSPQSKKPWIRIFVPATLANVGPGFDCFGLALEKPGDIVAARASRKPGVRIESITGDQGALPTEASANTAGKAAQSLLACFPGFSKKQGLTLRIEKGLPIGSGLGSSASSAVGGAVAAMRVIMSETGIDYDDSAVLNAAVTGEEVASGDWHADNVAPALYGGFTLVQSLHPLRVARFIPALELNVVIATPEVYVSTRDARAVLPRDVPLRDAVAQWANAASLILALNTGDVVLLQAALQDHLIEPRRASLIPGYIEAKRLALEAGALGCSIGGSGPTVFAFAQDELTAERIRLALIDAFARQGLSCQNHITRLSTQGAREC